MKILDSEFKKKNRIQVDNSLDSVVRITTHAN